MSLWQTDARLAVGGIFKLDGKRWKVTRKGTTAAVITRQYWFDDLIDWAAKKWNARSADDDDVDDGQLDLERRRGQYGHYGQR